MNEDRDLHTAKKKATKVGTQTPVTTVRGKEGTLRAAAEVERIDNIFEEQEIQEKTKQNKHFAILRIVKHQNRSHSFPQQASIPGYIYYINIHKTKQKKTGIPGFLQVIGFQPFSS